MALTFHGVLGVGPDADAEEIECGYRERVTDVHPDVNDDADADAQFKRLQTARDTLLDDDERARYDRLGHASYVRHHVSCSAWKSTMDQTSDSRGRTGSKATEADEQSSETPDAGGPSWAGRQQDTNETGSADRRRRTRRDSRGNERSNRGSDAGAARAGASDDGVDGRSRRSRGGRERTRRGPTGRDRADAGGSTESSYATSSFWESQRVGRRYGTNSPARDPLSVRLMRALRSLGPWAVIHLVFLTAAVGTSWYVYAIVLGTDGTSLPLLLVLVGEVALATTLSTVHVLTRVSR
jgi:curved DNA-binding protein CbpA